jgi:hypothetical protein
VLLIGSRRAGNEPTAIRRYRNRVENTLRGYLAAICSIRFHAIQKIRAAFDGAKNEFVGLVLRSFRCYAKLKLVYARLQGWLFLFNAL